jgi:hypothetical protein
MYHRLENLQRKTSDEIVALLATRPATVTSVDLSGDGFLMWTRAKLMPILVAMPATVRFLNLGMTFLGRLTGAELVELFAAIPATITSLSLSLNDLGKKTAAELADAFAALPASVTTLNLYHNNFNAEQLDAIIKALPVGVESIILDKKIIDRNEYWAEQLMVDVAELSTKQDMARFAFDTIKPPIEIDGKGLNRFIKFLEKQNNPVADLTCGLLLEGQIETTAHILENCNEYDEYMEKRTHDAISFYTKATNDAAIKPLAEFLLRNLKTGYPSASVQNRLALYDLTPQDNFNCELNQALKKRLGVSLPLLGGFGLFKPSSETESIFEVSNIGLEL